MPKMLDRRHPAISGVFVTAACLLPWTGVTEEAGAVCVGRALAHLHAAYSARQIGMPGVMAVLMSAAAVAER